MRRATPTNFAVHRDLAADRVILGEGDFDFLVALVARALFASARGISVGQSGLHGADCACPKAEKLASP